MCFFSSRRRHTSSLRDWSSDVCSSDLKSLLFNGHVHPSVTGLVSTWPLNSRLLPPPVPCQRPIALTRSPTTGCSSEIGRASCRESVKSGGVEGPLKTKSFLLGVHAVKY